MPRQKRIHRFAVFHAQSLGAVVVFWRGPLLEADGALQWYTPALADGAGREGGREGADAAAQAVHAAKPADALTTVLGSPSGATLRRVARDLDSTDLLLGLARRRNRPARRLAAARLSAAIDAWWTKEPVAETSAVAWPRSSDALRRDARQRKYAGRVARLLLRGHAGRQLSAGTRGLRATAALAWVAVRVSVDAAARSLWKGVRSLRLSLIHI